MPLVAYSGVGLSLSPEELPRSVFSAFFSIPNIPQSDILHIPVTMELTFEPLKNDLLLRAARGGLTP